MTPIELSSFAIIGAAGLIHASFQLSVSMLTLLGGHAIGKKTRHNALIRRMHSFNLGAGLITSLILATSVYVFIRIINDFRAEQLVASTVAGLLIGLGFATWAFYYRRKESGAKLWLPRGMAKFLTERSKATRSSSEALSLGMTGVVAEILFIIGPILAASLAIMTLPEHLQLAGIFAYTILSLMPLIFITALVGSGAKITHIQRWKESHKRFLQFAAGGFMLILAGFIFVDRVIGIFTYGGL